MSPAEKAALAASGCGLTIEGDHVFCDDPRASDESRQTECDFRRMIAAALAAQAPETRDAGGWFDMASAPKDGTIIECWHVVHKAVISVRWTTRGFAYHDRRLNWIEASYTQAWPDEAFSHWRQRTQAPGSAPLPSYGS